MEVRGGLSGHADALDGLCLAGLRVGSFVAELRADREARPEAAERRREILGAHQTVWVEWPLAALRNRVMGGARHVVRLEAADIIDIVDNSPVRIPGFDREPRR